MNTPSISKFRATVFTALLAVVSMAPSLQAQDHKVGGTIHVPFAFETGDKHFAPGWYTISMETTNVVLIKGASKSAFVMAQSGGGSLPAKKSKVVFRRSGDRYLLTEIWIAEESGHKDMINSKAERELLVAEHSPVPSGVELALLEIGRE
jgi:hypothetical protein